MSILINATKMALLSLCAAGYYATWYISFNNDTISQMVNIRDNGPQILPGTKEPIKTVYIGVPAIDYQLTVLVTFFWPVIDGSHPAASLFSFHFATQILCGWGLLMIEGLRRGHAWKVISFIGTMGFLVQNIAYAIVMPIYLILYLSTSPLVSSRKASEFLTDRSSIAAIPFSLALGFVLPTVLMSLSAPLVISFEQKQTFMAAWQVFPVWVAMLQMILPSLLATSKKDQALSTKVSRDLEMKGLRRVYAMLLLVAAIGQLSTFGLVAASRWLPSLFTATVRDAVNLMTVFVPSAISPSVKMPSIGSGAHLFLQYDELVGSTSIALFATALYVHARQGSNLDQGRGLALMGGLAAVMIAGPLGYAVAGIWARDELIAAETAEQLEQDNKKSR